MLLLKFKEKLLSTNKYTLDNNDKLLKFMCYLQHQYSFVFEAIDNLTTNVSFPQESLRWTEEEAKKCAQNIRKLLEKKRLLHWRLS